MHADVLQRGATEDRIAFKRDGSLANRGLDLVDGDEVGSLEERLHERVVEFGGLLQEIGSPKFRVVTKFFGNLFLVDFRTEFVGVEVERLHLEQVDDSREVVAAADRNLHRDRIGSEPFLDGLEAVIEVGTELVHLVDEAQAGNVVPVGLSPDGLGLRLDAFLSVEDGHRTVEHSQRPFDFDGEVDVAGGVDQVDLVFRVVEGPRAGGGRRLDRDATFLFLLEEVHGCRAFMHFADLVIHAGVEQDPLRDGGLTGIDVGADADIADAVEVDGHRWFLGLSLGLGEPKGSF